MDANGVVDFKDFTEDLPPKVFRVAGREFHAAAQIPIGLFGDLMELSTNMRNDPASIISGIEQFFTAILQDDEPAEFIAGLSDKKNPIGIQAIVKIMQWLTEAYGIRPTKASDSSGTTSETDASTSSTDGASLVTSPSLGADQPTFSALSTPSSLTPSTEQL